MRMNSLPTNKVYNDKIVMFHWFIHNLISGDLDKKKIERLGPKSQEDS